MVPRSFVRSRNRVPGSDPAVAVPSPSWPTIGLSDHDRSNIEGAVTGWCGSGGGDVIGAPSAASAIIW